MRYAGDLVNQYNPTDVISPQSYDEVYRYQHNKLNSPVVPGFNTEDLQQTPETTIEGPQFPGVDLMKDKYIRQSPKSGVAQGFKDGQEVALAPAVIKGVTAAVKGYNMYRAGKSVGNGIRDPQSVQGGGITPGSITADLIDRKLEKMTGPTLRSPYHQ